MNVADGKKSKLKNLVKILKWGKLLAKLAAIGTTISGAVAALSGSATAGITISAAGATTYAATKGIPTKGYEKTKHIPPGKINKQANMLRQQEISGKVGGKSKVQTPVKPKLATQASVLAAKQPSAASRSAKTASLQRMPRKN